MGAVLFFAVAILLPIVLSAINLFTLFSYDNIFIIKLRVFECFSLVIGIIFTLAYMSLLDIKFGVPWHEALVNSEIHSPIWEGDKSFFVFCFVAIVGYIILAFTNSNKLPPLVNCLALSAMYIGAFECIVWCIQVCNEEFWVLTVVPINYIIIVIRMTLIKISEYNFGNIRPKEYKSKLLAFIDKNVRKSAGLPIMAFILMFPLFGILLIILILFGQSPDCFIKAWTETAEWRLSAHEAPQNICIDEHYLCTVAAGGHRKIVKPVRLGIRHGHRVIVNRQLMIANAFEQILEERIPKIHRVIRNFYDTYGFPVARLIKSRWIADIIYILMKPLEWFFLFVIYLVDVKPENRIAVQYITPIKSKNPVV